MSRALFLALLPAMMASSALAQVDHSQHQAAPPVAAASDPHAGHAMGAAPAGPAVSDPHAGHRMTAEPSAAAAASGPPPVSDASVALPETPTDHLADVVWGREAMERSRETLRAEHGGARVSQLMSNILEYAPRSGDDGYRWDIEGWWGGDVNRVVVKTEGEGAFGEEPESAEVQLLYSRAVARYTDLQVGLRRDVGSGSSKTYLAAGFESLLPYWFQTEGAVFVSDDGDLFGRFEGTYDFRLTQRLVLQPRAELEFAGQDVARDEIASGVTSGEFGLRLRYEIRREFAPYIGVSHERAFGGTADFARARGEKTRATTLVLGLRAWF